MTEPVDILILSNGPGELVTWVKPTLRALRQQLGHDRHQVRISIVLSPCPNASGSETTIAESYGEVDRVQGATDFLPFLLWGKTSANWDWRSRGVVLFLGGDQLFPVIIGKRLGYKTVLYCEWDARWQNWVDRFAVMKSSIVSTAKPAFRDKFMVVGDLMNEVGDLTSNEHQSTAEIVGLLPGSKRAKLMQGVPIMLAIADLIRQQRPTTQFVIPVAPTLTLAELASYARVDNPAFDLVNGSAATLIEGDESYLETTQGTRIILHQKLGDRIPPYDVFKRCTICITTAGANTAELGTLAVPMIMILPTNQLDAMRAWNGVTGLLANLPGIGTIFARVINQIALRRVGLLAWPNKWANTQIVPERVGQLYPDEVADLTLDYLTHPHKLQTMRDALKAVRGEAGAADKLATIVTNLIYEF
ncbi:lipid-A-disaccharide synthase [filamentous cyanobacterium LEGE 11480]|uniref:Lipid-A-disaccharide synthase n=2 Tax=Romeriopsis TaxID=2992131 RepID=A0A928Z156_9CYAN|nr:lipid-A-disaccharide synthase [Romeriopsis navalis LEGE 11480]